MILKQIRLIVQTVQRYSQLLKEKPPERLYLQQAYTI